MVEENVYPVVLPERYAVGRGRYRNTAEDLRGAEVFDAVWVGLRRRAVRQALKRLGLEGAAWLPEVLPDGRPCPEWVSMIEHGSEEILAVVRIEEFM